ncbi:hypothetical protein [Mesorhizobium marinum]|uniref:hypothetical protein n=1 Tax=Mesorhizobium marinum TaxID=3228790 RepID=UPI0034667F9D
MTRFDPLTHDGITQPIVEWALDYGIPPGLILKRLQRGMSVGPAITTPMRARPGDVLDELDFACRSTRRGVVDDLPDAAGTGGGSFAQERDQIEFSANPEKAAP